MKSWYVFRCKDPRFPHPFYGYGTEAEAQRYFDLMYDAQWHEFLPANFGTMAVHDFDRLANRGEHLGDAIDNVTRTVGV